jgi:hypothetical protein
MVAHLGPLFGTTGHKVKTEGITPSSGLKRGDIEIINYLSDSAGSRNLVIDVSIKASPMTDTEAAQLN